MFCIDSMKNSLTFFFSSTSLFVVCRNQYFGFLNKPSVLFLLGSYGNLDWPASESQATTLPSQTPVQSSIPQPVPGQSPITYGQSQMNVQPNQTLPQRPGIPTPPTSHLNPLNQVCKLIILPFF